MIHEDGELSGNTAKSSVVKSMPALIILAVVLALLLFYPPKQNFNLFYTPSQIAKGLVASGQSFRLGGQIKKGTIKQDANKLQVAFVVSDPQHNVLVEYQGVLPDLFREGQSVVIEGRLDPGVLCRRSGY
ncbi:cytochrome c maturation protein CcmE [Rickettsiella endosymbiont of Dermanyssus gallinae]|uniref:cytochrome c maturation protein CcmE n=1 Tax=Rickettsiella endosymbiont of Dermanyssus gallinae TaxID=2856608 RepID=UPI001C5330D1|nr:cytochrome c maturation protein CcmE [Rickettsiella endosymbiont of Dermanyssus gallinae]